MNNILPRVDKQPSTSDRFLDAFSNMSQTASTGIPQLLQGQKQAKKENETLKKLTGEDLSGLSPDMKKIYLQNFLKKKEEDTAKFETGIETINAMRDISRRKNIGRGSQILGMFPGDTAKDRAEYAQLGKSLIPLVAAGVPVRNIKEFEEYKKIITDPSAPLSAIEGALNGLERLFSSKISGKGLSTEDSISEEIIETPDKVEEKVKFDISNPSHKKKRDQLIKKFKGDRSKVSEILEREFY